MGDLPRSPLFGLAAAPFVFILLYDGEYSIKKVKFMEKIGAYWHKIVVKFRTRYYNMLFHASENPHPGADDPRRKWYSFIRTPILWGGYFVLRVYLQIRLFPIIKVLFGFR